MTTLAEARRRARLVDEVDAPAPPRHHATRKAGVRGRAEFHTRSWTASPRAPSSYLVAAGEAVRFERQMTDAPNPADMKTTLPGDDLTDLRDCLRWAKPTTFVCLRCAEVFTIRVWHCPVCDHHWPMARRSCWNCHAYSLPGPAPRSV